MAQKKEYVASREVERAREAVRAHEQARPGEYRSEYDQALKEAMDRILNQKDFQYRLNGDALYRQYRSQAVRDARRAMSDTMGQAAALAGGYGSSYAQAVGQQAYARQLEGLADRIPELYGGVCMALAHTSPGQHYPNVFDDQNAAYAIPEGVEYKLLHQETGDNCYILTEYPLDRAQLDWTTFGES